MRKRNYPLLIGVLFIVGACGKIGITQEVIQRNTQQTSSASTTNPTPSADTARPAVTYDEDVYHQLMDLTYTSGESAVYQVNNGQSTLNMDDWQENKVVYGNLDALNRTTVVTAYINKQNLGHSEGRSRQTWQPAGWHQKRVEGEMIVNRGHLLAYTSSFNFDEAGHFKQGESGSEDNPKNLATQTQYSNQEIQTRYEQRVREAQSLAGNKVSYQIVTVFRADELMSRGYWLQAKDRLGTLDFNVYVFNVQPHVVFNYADGTSQIDPSMEVRN